MRFLECMSICTYIILYIYVRTLSYQWILARKVNAPLHNRISQPKNKIIHYKNIYILNEKKKKNALSTNTVLKRNKLKKIPNVFRAATYLNEALQIKNMFN